MKSVSVYSRIKVLKFKSSSFNVSSTLFTYVFSMLSLGCIVISGALVIIKFKMWNYRPCWNVLAIGSYRSKQEIKHDKITNYTVVTVEESACM